jgi:hypothetical protein
MLEGRMSEMLERVARAIWEAEGVAFGWCDADRRRAPTWDDAVARELFGVGPFRIFARAAIAAMLLYLRENDVTLEECYKAFLDDRR